MFSAKGKGRATTPPFGRRVAPRAPATLLQEGSGGSEGIVLPLQFLSDGPYDISYTLPILVGSGSSAQNLSVQIDTGSSDLWIASSSCGSSACSQAPAYNPTTETSTPFGFEIQYLIGEVSGPVVWDTVSVGGYNIDNQALAAADYVESEPLSAHFSGVLGLALPANSVIAGLIPPGVNDAPDGAVLTSNLFGITPVESAPAARFVSFALARPGSDAVPSVLGIGRHPSGLVPDPSRVMYEMLYGGGINGPLFWKGSVRAITVYTDAARLPIDLGLGVSGIFPTGVLDTGVPVILSTKTLADAIYGALGVQQGSDGTYYVQCRTPLNMTITLDSRAEIPLHPLDLTTLPPSSSSHPDMCIGLIQTSADSTLSDPSSGLGDMILGVPFLRNVYTVLAYEVPNADGSFPSSVNRTGIPVRPRLGLMPLTDPTVALDEFHRVRVLNQPLSSGNTGPIDDSPSNRSHKSTVAVPVLIGLGSFVGLCLLLFGLRWLFVRHRLRRRGGDDADMLGRDAKRDLALALGGYQLARRGGRPDEHEDDGLPHSDDMRGRRYEAYMQHSQRTMSTDRKLEPSADEGKVQHKDGAPPAHVHETPQQPWPEADPAETPLSPPSHSPLLEDLDPETPRHSRVLSVQVPLLPSSDVADESTDPTPRPMSMAGVGAGRVPLGARRSSALSES